MDIDVNRLINGDEVVCDLCHRGKMKPMYTDDTKKAHLFACDECGSTIHLYFKMPKSR